jgi:O-acetyl-ADP-ribose deacetylase (regulator of RNase III)
MRSEGYVHAFEIDAAHTLHIYRGSLVEVEADALVSSDDNYLSAGGGVSAALADAAGLDVDRERVRLVQHARPSLGDVVRTSAGALPSRYLYHAITIDFDRHEYMDDAALRRLIANLLAQASADGVRSLGLPALGTGAGRYDLARAAEIIIDELLVRLVTTPIRRVVLALIGDDAERLFYERLVRSRADRLSALELRRRDTAVRESPAAPPAGGPRPVEGLPSDRTAPADEVVEQFPSLIDEARLASAAPDRPRLVDGLADLILKHAAPEDVEQELLSSPACQHFRGTVKQRLMEFLYVSEGNLRAALGPALFKNKDLRRMLQELGEDSELPRDQDQLVTAILRALCFNTLAPPVGVRHYIAAVERLLDVLRGEDDKGPLTGVVLEAAKVLEQMLKDLLRMYGYYFWGSGCEAELVRCRIVPPQRDGNPLARLTLGQARAALEQLNALATKDSALRGKWQALGRGMDDFLPRRLEATGDTQEADCREVLRAFIELRNRAAHTGAGPEPAEPQEVRRAVDGLHAVLCACQAGGYYPDVLRYEGTFENRNGERFVYFLDEKGSERKVRTDERIDARQHYYCFATNNPVHLHPTLIPKL